MIRRSRGGTCSPPEEFSHFCRESPGTAVTYLTRFYNTSAWDYVEVKVNGKTARGFVPAGCPDVPLNRDIPQGDESLIEQ